MLLLVLGLAHAEMWGATNEGLADQATLIAKAVASDGQWASVQVVRGDLARMPVDGAPESGEWLVVCDEQLCPRALGRREGDGWVLHGRQPHNGAVISPGLVAEGLESTLGVGANTCLRTEPVVGVSWRGVVDGEGGAALSSTYGEARSTVRTFDHQRDLTVTVSHGSGSLQLSGAVRREGDCWVLTAKDLRPPLRGRDDLDHWMQSVNPLEVASGVLTMDSEVPVTLSLDQYGQLLLALDGEAPIASYGARSMVRPRMGTRWMYRVGDEELEIGLLTRDGRGGAPGLLDDLAVGPVSLEVFRGDAAEPEGVITLSAAR